MHVIKIMKFVRDVVLWQVLIDSNSRQCVVRDEERTASYPHPLRFIWSEDAFVCFTAPVPVCQRPSAGSTESLVLVCGMCLCVEQGAMSQICTEDPVVPSTMIFLIFIY